MLSDTRFADLGYIAGYALVLRDDLSEHVSPAAPEIIRECHERLQTLYAGAVVRRKEAEVDSNSTHGG